MKAVVRTPFSNLSEAVPGFAIGDESPGTLLALIAEAHTSRSNDVLKHSPLPGCTAMTLNYETLVYQQKVVHLQPPHRLDLMGGVSFQRQITAIEPEPGSLWLIDMAPVEFIDSAGRLALVKTLGLAQANGCRLLICNLPPSIKIIFELTQLDRVFELVDSSTELGNVDLLASGAPLQTTAPIAA